MILTRIMVAVAALFLLVGCSRQESQQPTNTTTNAITADKATQALFRMLGERVDKICTDSIQGYLIHYTDEPNTYGTDGTDDGWHGWYVSDKYKFYPLENGTWITTPIRGNEITKIAPDTTDLNCYNR